MKYLIYISLFLITPIIAQNGGTISFPDARSVAMGSQVAVTSNGVYSIAANPANLAYQKSKFQISTLFPVPSINAFTGNDFMSFNELDYYFGGVKDESGNLVGRYLDTSQKDTLLSKFSDKNNIQINFAVNLFSATFFAGKEIGSFGFSINDVIGQKTNLPKDLIDLGLNGNEVGRTYYLRDFQLSTSYLREYDFSYARDFSYLVDNIFESFSAGITLKIISGFAYSEVERIETQISTLEDHSIQIQNDFKANIAVSPDFGINWDFDNTAKTQNISPFMKPAGSGFGINLGFAAQLDSIWNFGLSITDIGSVSWNSEPVTFESKGSYLITDIIDSTLSDSISAYLEPTGKFTNSFSSTLPTTLRVGASFRIDKMVNGDFPGEMLIAIGYNQGFNNSVNNTTTPLFSVGVEWKPAEIIPIRSGFSFGGFNGFAWSLGFGINTDIFEINFASADVISVLQGNDSKIVQFTVGSVWKF
jgi:hypothetical protein